MENVPKFTTLADAEISDLSNKELKKLKKQLSCMIADTRTQLQASREERERIDKDIERCISDRDRLLPMVAQTAKQAEVLREWDAERQRASALSRRQEELEADRSSFKQTEKLKKKEAALMEEEKRLTVLCDEMRTSLMQTQSRCQAAEEELQAWVAGAASSQSKKGKEEQLVDEFVTKLGIPATLSQAGIKPKRSRKASKAKESK